MGNRFHTLFTGDNEFSRHFVDIHQAIADGVPQDAAQLAAGIDDEDAWNQEYLCLFIDEASAWLTYEMIAACQDPSLPEEIPYEEFDLSNFAFTAKGRLFAGVDIGRKKDLTVIDINELLGDVFYARLMVTLPRIKFSRQENLLRQLIEKLRIERTCIDATGIGAQLAENIVDQVGPYRAEEVEFTNKVKNDLATRTRRIFEDRLTRIPVSRVLRDDLHSIKKTTTAAGNIRFDAARSEIGHADRFWAKSLAFAASDLGAETPQCIVLR